jgi:hypothetical protein
MPKSHKRWTSYELMLKRVKKRPYTIAWQYHLNSWHPMPPIFVEDLRHPVIITADREVRASNRAWWAGIHERVLTLAMVFHPRLGESSLWHDLPEGVMCMIVCEAYL